MEIYSENDKVILTSPSEHIEIDHDIAVILLREYHYKFQYKLHDHRRKVVIALLKGDCRIDAIKYIKTELKLDLRASKCIVDAVQDSIIGQ